MADRRDANGLAVIGHLVGDAIGTDPQGAHSTESAAKCVTGVGVAFERRQSVLDGVGERPVEVEKLEPRAPCEDDARQRSAGGSAFAQLAPKVLERHGLVA